MAQMKVETKKHPGGRPPKYTSPEELQTKIDEYFSMCDETGRPYTMSGLAYALDMDRRSLINYGNNEQFFHTIQKARERVQVFAEERLTSGNGNTAGIIFALKNNYGWTDIQTIDAKVDESITINVSDK